MWDCRGVDFVASSSVVTLVTLVRHNVVMQCDTGEGEVWRVTGHTTTKY